MVSTITEIEIRTDLKGGGLWRGVMEGRMSEERGFVEGCNEGRMSEGRGFVEGCNGMEDV